MSFQSRVPIILELGFNKESLTQLEAYVQLLWSSNEDLNLISRQMSFDELMDNHVIDSLLPLRLFPRSVKKVADFGSGGGLPAVLYALQFPQIEFHLFEKSPKKQDFLKRCQSLAPNLKINGEIPKALESIDLVTARGFKPIEVILEFSRSYYKAKGKYFLLKARREKIDEEVLLARKKFKDLQVQIEVLKSPVLDVERHLVLI